MRKIPRHYRPELDRWGNTLIDLDLQVDDSRAELDRAVQALRNAVRERDRAAEHLRRLIEFADVA